MDVVFLIRELVMVAVIGSPPQNPFLDGKGPQESHDKLRHPGKLVRAVGEIPVIAGGQPEHPHDVKSNADG